MKMEVFITTYKNGPMLYVHIIIAEVYFCVSLQTIQNLTNTLLLPFAVFTICCVIIKVMVVMTTGNVIYNHKIGNQKVVVLWIT